MSFLSAYGLFLLEVFTLVIGAAAVFGSLANLKGGNKKSKHDISVTDLSKKRLKRQRQLFKATLVPSALKSKQAACKQARKSLNQARPRLFVLDFEGDIGASSVSGLREAITAIVTIYQPEDKVLLRLNSGGGTVNGYGLAAAQLQRLRDKAIDLTVSVDKIAASGGYMMACVGNRIIASPFAIIGSIGVVAQLPNIHRWLKKHDVDVELITAGEYKRTLTLLGENTAKGRQKFTDDIQSIHQHFKDHITQWRSKVSLDRVATGEYWLAREAQTLQLVDELITSDAWLEKNHEDHHVFHLETQTPSSMMKRLLQPASQFISNAAAWRLPPKS